MKRVLCASTAILMLCVVSCSRREPAAPDASTLDALSRDFDIGVMDRQDLDGDGDADRGTFTITEDRTDDGRASVVYAIESWFPRETKTWERLTQQFAQAVPDAGGYGDGCDPWGPVNIECRWNQPTGVADPYGNDIDWYTNLKVTLYGSDARAQESLEAMPAQINQPDYASSAKREVLAGRVIDTIIIPTPGGGPTQKQIRQNILYGNTIIYIEGIGPVGGEKGSEAIERTIKSIIDAKRAGGKKAPPTE